MSKTSQRLCAVYGATAVLALIGTWHQNLNYFGAGGGFSEANLKFWGDTLANPASISITVDIFVFGLAATVWMVHEARRWQVRFVWLYVLFGLLIAISVTFPLFLIARERRIASTPRPQGTPSTGFTPLDVIVLTVFGLGIVGFTCWTLSQ